MKNFFFALFTTLILALLGANCGGNNAVVDAGGIIPTGDAGACQNGNYALCNSTCVDIQGDSQNCGGCGKTCPSDEVCTHGACAVVCGGGSSRCGSNCVDLKSDPLNCGGCNTQCSQGQVCSAGTCALTCVSGQTNCAGACVDLTADDGNCNGCGSACPAGQVCVNSQCSATCQSGWTSCANDAGTTCVDTTSDPNNCNGCGNACPSGYFCINGQCGVECAGGTTQCGSGLSAVCVDENIDPNHCGSCTTTCPSGDVCSSAHCCPTSTPFYCGKCDTFSNCVLKTGGHIVGGADHTCAINTSGAVYCWGYGGYGQLGNSSTSSYNSAQAASVLTSNTASLSAYEYGTCAVDASNNIYCWGMNYDGEVGDGTTTNRSKPTSIISSNGVAIGSGGYYANCFLLKSGAVECTGYDEYSGLLDLGTTSGTEDTSPTAGSITSGAANIGGGAFGYSMCAITTSGGLECWGSGSYTLGDGSTYSSGSPVTVTGVTGALQVSVGGNQTCVVSSGGKLQCWGYNNYGELGDGSTTPYSTPVTASLTGVISVSCGWDHTCALTSGGQVWCVGYNYYGQLGNGSSGGFSANTSWQEAITSGAVAVGVGGDHSCALLSSGKAQCWGYNGNGQLGTGSYTDSSTAVTVSGF